MQEQQQQQQQQQPPPGASLILQHVDIASDRPIASRRLCRRAQLDLRDFSLDLSAVTTHPVHPRPLRDDAAASDLVAQAEPMVLFRGLSEPAGRAASVGVVIHGLRIDEVVHVIGPVVQFGRFHVHRHGVHAVAAPVGRGRPADAIMRLDALLWGVVFVRRQWEFVKLPMLVVRCRRPAWLLVGAGVASCV
ncbi:uncharacterized protein K489DRAFT_222365 [Dissoconium aciculare CBS 342.82]|uniref:Uncharacterized protein n=1 Tax=Dissoconium aciculare CBS 342.82 TaxID=1314786 RepID=A0A6J3M7Z9_9PEZI|nr:uncharacterized protein K489DRAFT_222365 [Dissoconium aciculare CBS 342.82]KAF1822977.1 hypothetical protein K489DRAFT_222365 [Dissoconium aciculare CBS 342.82]